MGRLLDVRENQEDEINILRWTNTPEFDLINSELGVDFIGAELVRSEIPEPLVQTKIEAENLIKALQKAIELGWVK